MTHFDSALISFSVSVGVGMVLAILATMARKRARSDIHTGELVLEYGWGIKGFAVGVSAFWLIIFAVLYATGGIDLASSTSLLGMAVVIFAIVIPLLLLTLEAFGVSYRIDALRIKKRSPWTRDTSVTWQEIESVTFNLTLQWFVVRSRVATLRLHAYLTGLGDFALAVIEKLPQHVWAKASSHILERVEGIEIDAQLMEHR